MGAIHFWDMDHTLIDNDCDVSWKEFLIAEGLAPASDRDLIDLYYEQYAGNELDEAAFMAFQLREFVGHDLAHMRALTQQHFEALVRRTVYPAAYDKVQDLRGRGEAICLLTATNRIIAEPVAAHFGFPDIVATELQLKDGRFTGEATGTCCVGLGKIKHLQAYCTAHDVEAADVWYYGDSVADIQVLSAVGHPVAVNPMPELRQEAAQRNWPIIEF